MFLLSTTIDALLIFMVLIKKHSSMAQLLTRVPHSYLLCLLWTITLSLYMTLMAVAHPSPSCCHWTVLPVSSKLNALTCWTMRKISPHVSSHVQKLTVGPLDILVFFSGGEHSWAQRVYHCQLLHRPSQLRHDCVLRCLWCLHSCLVGNVINMLPTCLNVGQMS